MSLFMARSPPTPPSMQDRVKYGVLAGSLMAGVAGYLALRMQRQRKNM